MTSNKYWIFLERLRQSGVTNMYGAIPFLMEGYDISSDEARTILVEWMKNYDAEDYSENFFEIRECGEREFTSSEYRTCTVNGRKALFHRWADRAEPVPGGLTVGGAPAGQLQFPVGIVEFENGEVKTVRPWEIRFACNQKFGEAIWLDTGDTHEDPHADYERLKQERDAAVRDIYKLRRDDYALMCDICALQTEGCKRSDGEGICDFKWRGIQEDNNGL